MLIVCATLLSAALLASALHADDVSECPLTAKSAARNDGMPRLHDIKAVMAIGDSLMSALAAKSNSILQEYRGSSFATGSDPNAHSIFSFLSFYNPQVVGGSRGAHPVAVHSHYSSPYSSPLQDRLNVAISGATSQSVGVQLKELKKRAVRLPHLDFANDWKLLAVSIGAQDLCQQGCIPTLASGQGSGEYFEERMRTLLETVHERFPRTVVSILLLPDLSQSHRFMAKHPKRCGQEHVKRAARMVCPCAHGSDEGRWALNAVTADFNERIVSIAREYNRLGRVKVHVSGIFRDFVFAKHLPNAHLLSELDCLHFTADGQSVLAANYWNSLFSPLATQQPFVNVTMGVYCAEEDDTIALEV